MKGLRYAYINRKTRIPSWIRDACRSVATTPMLMMLCTQKAMQLCYRMFYLAETRNQGLSLCIQEIQKWVQEMQQKGLNI